MRKSIFEIFFEFSAPILLDPWVAPGALWTLDLHSAVVVASIIAAARIRKLPTVFINIV